MSTKQSFKWLTFYILTFYLYTHKFAFEKTFLQLNAKVFAVSIAIILGLAYRILIVVKKHLITFELRV